MPSLGDEIHSLRELVKKQRDELEHANDTIEKVRQAVDRAVAGQGGLSRAQEGLRTATLLIRDYNLLRAVLDTGFGGE